MKIEAAGKYTGYVQKIHGNFYIWAGINWKCLVVGVEAMFQGVCIYVGPFALWFGVNHHKPDERDDG